MSRILKNSTLALALVPLLVGCASDSGFHFEGQFLREDGSAAADIRVSMYNNTEPFSGTSFPDFEVFADGQGRYQIDISLADVSDMPMLSIVGGRVAVRVPVTDEWLDGSRSYDLGVHQFWSGQPQAASSASSVDISWQAVVDPENPTMRYRIELSGTTQGVWVEDTDATSIAIDTRKTQNFARTATIVAMANVRAGTGSGFATPPIEMWWQGEPVEFTQTTTIPPSRDATCTATRDGAEEPFETTQGACFLTDGAPRNGNFPSTGCDQTSATANQAFTIDLGAPTTVNAVGMLLVTLTEEVSLDVQLSTDNIGFATAATFATSSSRHRFLQLATPTTARYVRLQPTSGCIFRLGEVGIY